MQENQDSTVFLDASSHQEKALAPGVVIDEKYQIVSLIGRGGMGSVYRVHQMFLGKDFAFKVLDLNRRTEASTRRFKQEARTASQLQHPNLVGVHGFGVIAGEQPYLVMDLIEGVTLSDVLKSKDTLPVEYVVRLAIQLCFGLMYAHEKGVVHRDIKPGNIMLLHPEREPVEGTVKIVDFGIAKLTQSEDGEIQSLTETGEIFGSPVYMSPEQCKGTMVDKRSDIYSLGCVLYECLTGTPPFLGETAMATMLKRHSEKPASLKEATLGCEFPELLESIIQKMLAVEAEERYPDLQTVVNDFMALQQPEVGIVVTVVKDKPQAKRELKVPQKVIIALGTVVVSVAIMAIIDRAVIYPLWFAPSKVVADKGIRFTGIKLLEAHDALSKSGSGEDNPTFTTVSKAVRELEPGGFGTSPHDNTPKILNEKSADGTSKQFLYFPDDYGALVIDHRKSPAKGKVPLPPNASVTFRLNKTAAANDQLFKNLTGLRFHRIDFSSYRGINDGFIQILEKIPFLEQVGLEYTGVTSLKPLYRSKMLTHLEVGNTNVPASEILKVERLKDLQVISFGPMPNAYRVLDRLESPANITTVVYKGIRDLQDSKGFGLTSRDITSLGKLTQLRHLTVDASPEFNDENLEKLVTLQSLNSLRVIDCGLTPKCIPTLAKFKKLRRLNFTAKGWPESDLAILRRKYQFEQRKTHEDERSDQNSGVDALTKYLDRD